MRMSFDPSSIFASGSIGQSLQIFQISDRTEHVQYYGWERVLIMENLNHPNLSLEVIERIIDIVTEHENDPSSIKACSLVSHSILPRCRYHIFASVTLNARVGKRAISPTSDNFNHLLSNSPHLAVYVRDLDYHFNKERDCHGCYLCSRNWSSYRS